MKRKSPGPPPEGFLYQTEILSTEEERDLIEIFRMLPLQEYDFHGFKARRRVVYYGWQYDSSNHQLKPTEEIPTYLLDLRKRAASFATLSPDDLVLAQIIEYRPGAAIGSHRDRDVFGDIIGISLLSPCSFRFRRQIASGWERYSLIAEPRSIYLLRGPSRSEWQHSIPAVDVLRFSVVFRTLQKTYL
jgi:alkylated DNA repair dioxygenase AlkB